MQDTENRKGIDSTRWFKCDRDAVRLVYTQISRGHIWTTL